MVGLREVFDEHAARVANEQGWVVVSPEPFPGHPDGDVWQRYDYMAGVDAPGQVADVLAAADATGCDRVALLGFCLGGFQGYQAAPTGRFEAIVSMYGPIKLPEVWRRNPLQTAPLDALRRPGRTTPLLAIIAGIDAGTPPDDVDELRGVYGVDAVVYDEADHAFVHDPIRPAHRAADAADAWDRALHFLKSPPVVAPHPAGA
jgi:carboxymethylenebutenolidase